MKLALTHIIKLNKCIILIELKHGIAQILKIQNNVFMDSTVHLFTMNKNLEFNYYIFMLRIKSFICMIIKQ
jgi:hypothetical protein